MVTDEILKPADLANPDTLLPMGQGQEFSADLYQSNGFRQQYRVYCKPGYVVTRGPPINNSPNFDLDEHGNPKNYLNIECRSKNGEIPGFKPVVEGYKCGTQLEGDGTGTVSPEKNTCDYRDEASDSGYDIGHWLFSKDDYDRKTDASGIYGGSGSDTYVRGHLGQHVAEMCPDGFHNGPERVYSKFGGTLKNCTIAM